MFYILLGCTDYELKRCDKSKIIKTKRIFDKTIAISQSLSCSTSAAAGIYVLYIFIISRAQNYVH